jgi:Domain of unknown function (DUF1707)
MLALRDSFESLPVKEARCPVDSNRTLRVSDADRDAAVSELGEHFQDGRLDRDELEDRTGRALRARRIGGSRSWR